MNLKTGFFFLFQVITSLLFAQKFPSDQWYKGVVYLSETDSVNGSIKYDLKNDLINVTQNGLMHTFTSKKISYFQIESTEGQRLFITLPYEKSQNYRSPVLFEVITAGKRVSFLVREKIVLETVPQYYNGYRRGTITRQVLDYDYYLLFSQSRIEKLREKTFKELTGFLPQKDNHLKEFIKDERLNLQDKKDFARVIEYFNQLK
jgi:hypothetical protein